jgi:hypothetical protein
VRYDVLADHRLAVVLVQPADSELAAAIVGTKAADAVPDDRYGGRWDIGRTAAGREGVSFHLIERDRSGLERVRSLDEPPSSLVDAIAHARPKVDDSLMPDFEDPVTPSGHAARLLYHLGVEIAGARATEFAVRRRGYRSESLSGSPRRAYCRHGRDRRRARRTRRVRARALARTFAAACANGGRGRRCCGRDRSPSVFVTAAPSGSTRTSCSGPAPGVPRAP